MSHCVMVCVLVAAAAAGLFQVISGQQSSDESRLFAFLQTRYKAEYKHTRPVVDHTQNVTVAVGINLIDIQDFDVVTGFGTFYCYDKLAWTDAHLTWEPRQFGGVTEIRLPNEMIWKPDVVLLNSQDMTVERYQSMVVVQHTGDVLWVPRSKYHIRCYEPEDQSADFECKFKFASWVYNLFMLDPVLYMGQNQTDVNEFFANHHWDIVENYAEKSMKTYDCCPEPYPDVTFYLKLNYNGPTSAAVVTSSSSSSSFIAVLLLMAVAQQWCTQ